MRGFIIKPVSPEDVREIRHLRATEGYLELGLFEEAAEELRELDPAWFALEQTLNLQVRVLAGLNQAGLNALTLFLPGSDFDLDSGSTEYVPASPSRVCPPVVFRRAE